VTYVGSLFTEFASFTYFATLVLNRHGPKRTCAIVTTSVISVADFGVLSSWAQSVLMEKEMGLMCLEPGVD
jgi:hypothetical protein